MDIGNCCLCIDGIDLDCTSLSILSEIEHLRMYRAIQSDLAVETWFRIALNEYKIERVTVADAMRDKRKRL